MSVKLFSKLAIYACIVLSGALMYLLYITRVPPSDFPVERHFVVHENESIRSVSMRLEEGGYLYSGLLFRAWVSALGRDRHIQIGEYTFSRPLVMGALIKKFVTGSPDLPLLSVTIPEGSTTYEIALLISKALPNISQEKFMEAVKATGANGKLFPSTYFLLPSYSAEDVVRMMIGTFTKKTELLLTEASYSGVLHDEHDVIVLASILEGEAKTKDDMAIVAGILQTRLRSGMALQVDVAKETYKARGLPNEPINNPGLIAIESVLRPISSNYVYYLTGKDGAMHYTVTFDEHKKNIQKYLR